jgi:O-antigen/teichoic acid export membrane protein
MTKSIQSHQTLHRTLWMFVGYALRMAFQAAAFVMLARSLGVQQFGALSATLALAMMIAPMVDLGAYNLAVRDIVAGAKTNRVVGNNLMMVLVTFPFALMVALVVKGIFLTELGWYSTFLVSTAVFLGGRIQSMSNGVYVAHGLNSQSTQMEILNGLTLFLCAGFFWLVVTQKTNHPLEVWSLMYVGQAILVSTIALMRITRKWGNIDWDWSEIRSRGLAGIHFAITSLASNAYADIDKAMLARISTLGSAGIFTAAHRFVAFALVPLAAFNAAVYPKFFASGQQGLPEARRLAIKILPITTGYGTVATIVVYLIAPVLLPILGQGYGDAVEALRFLAPLIVLHCVQLPFAESLTGSGYQAERSVIQITVLIFSVLLNVFLIPTYSWKGAAVSAVLSQLLMAVLMVVAAFTLRQKSFAINPNQPASSISESRSNT